MSEEIKHFNIGQKYRVVFERGAVKGVDGFKVESNDDDSTSCFSDALDLYNKAIKVTQTETKGE